MEKYVLLINSGTIIIQEAEYIEHGYFIKIEGSEITLYEIYYPGGESEVEVGKFSTLIEAIEHSNKLT